MKFNSVVRVFATIQEPDYDSPWQPRAPTTGTGSGVVIAPRRILTGAHVVANATFVQVQKVSNPEKCTAKVIAVCHDTDLALLEVCDESFLDGIEEPQIGELPELRDPVSVVGYPVGGDEISITEGVVSRIELQRYRQSRRLFLAITVDAAINDGNSGGPAFKDGKIIGIAFQTLKDAENIGELVPSTLIRSFLRSVDESPKVTLPALGVCIQSIDNPQLKKKFSMKEEQSGCLVSQVSYGSSAWGHLKPDDVILEIEGHPVAGNGTLRYLNRLRTGFGVLLGERRIGDPLELRILRKGTELSLTLTLAPLLPLVPQWQYDCTPSYLVYGGLVFQSLTLDYLATWSDWWDNAPSEFLNLLYAGVRSPQRQEIVILSKVLADEINVGYEQFVNESIVSVQGEIPRDLDHFASLLRSGEGPTELRTSRRGLIVLDPTAAEEANQRIKARYRVQALCSEDLQA